jgi:hypothetical protein
MTDDDLDHLLESHDDIVPSSGFTDAVMAALHNPAWETPPLPFPWKHAALGPLMAVFLVVLSVTWGFVRPATLGSALAGVVRHRELLTAIGDTASRVGLGWMALALLLTLASVGLSSRLASRTEGHS